MVDATDWLPFLLLREDVEELRDLREPAPQTRVLCPRLQLALWDERDAVELTDLLAATLSAISRSRSKLKGAAGIALADDPIPFTFKGELVGVSEGAASLSLVVQAEGRRKSDG